MSSCRIPEIQQIQALMDRVDTHRHQPLPPVALSPAELTQHTLEVYRDQGVEVDPQLVAYLASQPEQGDLPTELPHLPDSPNDLRAAPWLAVGFLLPVAALFVPHVVPLSDLGEFMVWSAAIIFMCAFIAIGLLRTDSAATTNARSRKYVSAQLQRATLTQLEDFLVNPDCSEQVEKLAKAELLRRQRLLSITVDATEVVK